MHANTPAYQGAEYLAHFRRVMIERPGIVRERDEVRGSPRAVYGRFARVAQAHAL